ncbi:MAG: STAS domain-containing protein [Prolixibacteraceae bacterium]|jgi:anti-anti-sigma factor|nr:STAS domain-containing protein [Prolixibacteraceae bacterium]
MNNLEIYIESRGEEMVLKCAGRLDANWATHLNDSIDRLVRDGHYHLSLDLSEIRYLSSAGIRSLVMQYKNLKSVNGYFYIEAMSDNVNQVLSMVGMADMLQQKPVTEIIEKQPDETPDQWTEQGFIFKVSELLPDGKSAADFYGKPELVLQSGYVAENARKVQSEEKQFAIGLGAIGDSFDECKNRFGEYMMIGKNIAYLPADGSKKPDYMVSSGQLVASLTELYGIHFEGNFSHLLRFEGNDAKSTIGLSQLAENFRKLTNAGQVGMVMLAESGGLIGASLNASPVDGKKIFSFPEVKESLNFTTEPAHNKMLTLSVGYFSFAGNAETGKFTRPLQPATMVEGHVHTAVFPYIPMKKTAIDLDETIGFLFDTSELIDILHLTNDNREITGLGESQFVQGFCWIVPIESTHFVSTK